jgi:hypothetical protein
VSPTLTRETPLASFSKSSSVALASRRARCALTISTLRSLVRWALAALLIEGGDFLERHAERLRDPDYLRRSNVLIGAVEGVKLRNNTQSCVITQQCVLWRNE